MSLQDGEYDIDLSGLVDHPNSNNIALRYGFIPDSMDQKSSLKLYQIDGECLLSVQSTESSKSNLIFEGIPQRNKSSNIVNDSYYLTFDDRNVVHLKKLNSTIRLSKSRNVDRLASKLKAWDSQYEKMSESKSTTAAKSPPSNKPPKASKRPPSANTTPNIHHEPIISALDFDDLEDDNDFPVIEIIEPTNTTKTTESTKKSTPKPSHDTTPHQPLPKPSARPSERPSTVAHTVNSTTDARSLNPALNSTAKPAPKPAPRATKPQTSNILKSTKPKKGITKQPRQAKKTPKTRETKNDEDVDMDDDFKDLEDQLAEVLEEEEPAPRAIKPSSESRAIQMDLDADSDESDFDEYNFSGIKIDNGTSETTPKTTFLNSTSSNQKPVSLRDLQHDLSSSEEE
jgi:hypothetical protein